MRVPLRSAASPSVQPRPPPFSRVPSVQSRPPPLSADGCSDRIPLLAVASRRARAALRAAARTQVEEEAGRSVDPGLPESLVELPMAGCGPAALQVRARSSPPPGARARAARDRVGAFAAGAPATAPAVRLLGPAAAGLRPLAAQVRLLTIFVERSRGADLTCVGWLGFRYSPGPGTARTAPHTGWLDAGARG